MIFAFPELVQYRTNRGINLEPYEDRVPGAIVSDVGSLADRLASSATGRDAHVEQLQVMCRRLPVILMLLVQIACWTRSACGSSSGGNASGTYNTPGNRPSPTPRQSDGGEDG